MHRASILTTLTCLERKESGRAIYKRSDFPDMNPDMNKPLVIWQEEGRSSFHGALEKREAEREA